ncbi:MAG: glycosyltransferase family 2 protein [Dehalococcoidia bacterium]
MAKVKLAQPRVSIIILNWNGLEDTVECLESLKKITYPNYEVIVVDNGSQGNDAQVLKETFGDYIHLIQNDRNDGFAGGMNIGMKYTMDNSQPDYLLLLNNDVTVAPDFLDHLVEAAMAGASIGIAGPKVYYYAFPKRIQSAGSKVLMVKGLSFSIGDKQIDDGQYEKQQDVDCIAACLLVKNEVVQKVGLFDEAYFCYWEDVDYCIRAKKAGYRVIYAPVARIWHKVGQSANKTNVGFRDYYGTRNRIRLIKKHATRCQCIIFFIYFFGYSFWFVTGSLMYRRKMKQLAACYRGARDGLFDSDAGSKLYG